MAGWANDVTLLAHSNNDPTEAWILAVEKGGTLQGGVNTAAERRVFLGAQYFDNLNSNGKHLFDRALEWVSYTEGGGDYGLDLEVQWTNVIDFLPTEKLNIYTGTLGSENLRVDYWNGTGWENLATDLTANSCNEYVVSLTSTTFTVRFKDGTTDGDATQDQWQIDASLLRVEGAGDKEDAVDQQSNVDSSADVGNHSDFNAMKTKDGMNTLTEQDTGFQTATYNFVGINYPSSSHLAEEGEVDVSDPTDPAPSYADGTYNNRLMSRDLTGISGYVNRGEATSSEYDRIEAQDTSRWTTTDPGPGDNAWFLAEFYISENKSSITQLDIKFVGYQASATDKLWVSVWNYYYSVHHIVDYFQRAGSDGTFETTITNTTIIDHLINDADGLVTVVAFNEDLSDSIIVNYVEVKVTYSTGANYELDLEVQWTNLPYPLPNEELCICGGTMGTEDIKVDVWNGTGWENVFNNLSSGWNNASITNWLTTSNFTIRFKGGTETGDANETTWQIDVALIHVWHGGGENYELDLEVQWTSAGYTRTNEELCIKTGTFSGSENIQVKVWNNTGSSWHWIMNLTVSQWNNVSITSYLTSSTFTVQFLGGTETGDTNQDNWNIDATLLHVWTVETYYPSGYNLLGGTYMSGTVPSSVQTVDSDHFVVENPSLTTPTWWDSKYDYRRKLTVSEPNKLARNYEPAEVYLTFAQGSCFSKDTIRVAYWNGSTWSEIPSQVYNVTLWGDNTVKSATTLWNADVELNASKDYYVYYDEDGEVTAPSYTGLSTPSVVNRGTTFNLSTSYGTGDTIKITGTYYGIERNVTWINLKINPSTVAWGDWYISPGIFHLWINGSDVFEGGSYIGEADTGPVCEHSDGTNYAHKGNASSVTFEVVGPLLIRIKVVYPSQNPGSGGTISGTFTDVFSIYYTPDSLTTKIKVDHKQEFPTAFTEATWGDWAHLDFPAWNVTPTQTNLAYNTSAGTYTEALTPNATGGTQHSDWTERWIEIFDNTTVEPALGLFFMSDDRYTINTANYRVMNVGAPKRTR